MSGSSLKIRLSGTGYDKFVRDCYLLCLLVRARARLVISGTSGVGLDNRHGQMVCYEILVQIERKIDMRVSAC